MDEAGSGALDAEDAVPLDGLAEGVEALGIGGEGLVEGDLAGLIVPPAVDLVNRADLAGKVF